MALARRGNAIGVPELCRPMELTDHSRRFSSIIGRSVTVAVLGYQFYQERDDRIESCRKGGISMKEVASLWMRTRAGAAPGETPTNRQNANARYLPDSTREIAHVADHSS